MKHDIDIKITKNSEEKINKFNVEDYLKNVKSSETNQVEKDNVKSSETNQVEKDNVKSSETNQVEEDKDNIMPKISGWAILLMIVIVGVNFASNQSWWFKPIGRQTNVLAVLLVVLLIINELFKKKK